MRDDKDRWAPAADVFDPVTAKGVTLRTLEPQPQTLISGRNIYVGRKTAGWPDIITQDIYALSLKRDQVLVVGGEERASGWDAEQGCAVTQMTSGYVVFTLEGSKIFAVLERGGEISLSEPSRSVARRLFGFDVLLYRHGNDQCCRLHVSRPESHAFYRSICHAIGALY